MKIFACQKCSQLLFFENTKCEKCASALGYIPALESLSALEPNGADWQPLADPAKTYRFCANAAFEACNWLIDSALPDEYCAACRHNNIVPDPTDAQNLQHWRQLEFAKHRLIYTLLKLGLPMRTKDEDAENGLAFDFLADPQGGPRVMTGHDNGLITVALSEADDAQRESRRQSLHEPLRTLLGHLRHESGHYFWDRLVRDANQVDACRALFGNDELDYGAALKQHYDNGPPADWRDRFITAYASTHPWEDFAETWAHYLHIVDALDTARAFGINVHPKVTRDPSLHADISASPYRASTVEELIEDWLPLTYAVNSLNQSLGQPNLYPFVLTPPAIQKLGFVHALVQTARNAPAGTGVGNI